MYAEDQFLPFSSRKPMLFVGRGLGGRIQNLDLFFKPIAKLHFGAFGIEVSLDAAPEFDGGAEVAGQPQGRVGTDTALLVADFADPHGGHADVLGQPVLTDAQGFQKLLQEDFAGVNRGEISHRSTSMVVDNFDVVNTIVMPFKANPPLAVDTDRVLPNAITAQRLQAVGRRDAKIRQRFGKMQHCQFSCGQ